jgi:hypothetical protein
MERRPSWFLIAVAVLIAMGHICALPDHAVAAPASAHDDSDAHRHSSPTGGDESHLESCEGLRSAPTNRIVPPITALQLPALQQAASRLATSAVGLLEHRSFVAESPPLFLLYAALLI